MIEHMFDSPDPSGQQALDRARLHADLDRWLDASRHDGGPALAEALASWDRLRRAVDGAAVEALTGFEASLQWSADAHRSPVSWLAAETGMHRPAAGAMRRVALAASSLPAVAAAAAAGRLPHSHIKLLVDAREQPVVDLFDRDQDLLVAAACQLTADGLRQHLARWRHEALIEAGRNEPDGPEPPATDGNRLRLVDAIGGRGLGELDLDPQTNAMVRAGLDAEYDRLRRAGALDADPRTLAEIYGDLFAEIFARGIAHPDRPAPGALVTAVVDLDTLLRRAGHADAADRTARRAELLGGGPVSDDVIADLAARADISLLVTHPTTGLPLWLGRARRLATPAQRRAVLAASDGHCTFPGCTIAAHRCEIDHLTGWEQGGPTDIENLAPTCAFHNRLKHRRRVRARREADGSVTYTGADGTPIRSRYRHDP